MKTLIILIALGIFLSFSATLTNAQEMENGTVSYYMDIPIALELRCGDNLIDYIFIYPFEAHVLEHYMNGNRIWMKVTVHGTILSKGVTYEVNGKTNIIDEDIQEAHYNLKGDDGSHYVGTVTISDATGEFTFSKAMCPGN